LQPRDSASSLAISSDDRVLRRSDLALRMRIP
jgi:hypothetical protein